jgi:LysR family nitrogen assimilation transcriptional regulator
MEFRQLEYFVHVAELGSFTRAAELLGVAQSALSRHVRALEVELRQHLLHRDGRGATPTEAGKRLLAHGRGILLQVERATEVTRDSAGAPVGHVAIGLPHSLGRFLTVPFVLAFQERFPQGTLSITEGLTIHLHEWLTSGRLDLALLHDPAPSSSLETTLLQRDELFLLGPAGRRVSKKNVSLKELAGHPLILPRSPHPLRVLIETRLANVGRKPMVALEIDAVPAIGDLVAQGLGFAVVTMNALRVGGDAARFHFRRIVAPDLRSSLVLARSADRPATVLAQQVHELLAAFVPAHMQQPPVR